MLQHNGQHRQMPWANVGQLTSIIKTESLRQTVNDREPQIHIQVVGRWIQESLEKVSKGLEQNRHVRCHQALWHAFGVSCLLVHIQTVSTLKKSSNAA